MSQHTQGPDTSEPTDEQHGFASPHGPFFDRDRQPIDADTWANHFGDGTYRIVARNQTAHGSVVTLWSGADSDWCGCERHAPRIFGIAVYRHTNLSEEAAVPDQQQALRIHRDLCASEGPAEQPCPGGCEGS